MTTSNPLQIQDDLRTRCLITIAALIAYRAVLAVPLPGIDLQSVTGVHALEALNRLSIAAVGLSAWTAALLIGELATLLLPAKATRYISNRGHADPFAPFLIALAVAIAALQGFGIATAMERVRGLVITPGPAFQVMTMATLIGGTMLVILIGRAIQRTGLGMGFWIILAASTVMDVIPQLAASIESVRLGSAELSALLICLLVLAASYYVVAFLIDRRRSMGFAAPEPILWPIGIFWLVLANVLLPLAFVVSRQFTSDEQQQNDFVSQVIPPQPFGLLLTFLGLAAITYRYASREQSRTLWPLTLIVLFALFVADAFLRLYPETAATGFALSPGKLIIIATVGALITDGIRQRWSAADQA